MYGSYYGQNMQQMNIDNINAQMAELEKLKQRMQQQNMPQPTNLTQNFQITPSTHRDNMRYANSINDVKKELVIADTPFFSRDMSVVWIKSPSNEIKAYEMNEIIEKDEKDIQIEYLTSQIEELKGMIVNEQHNSNVIQSENETNTARFDEPVARTTQKSEPTSVSRVSKSKTR